MNFSDRLYDPERLVMGAAHAVELARQRGAAEIRPEDLLAGMLLAVARFGIVELGDRALDLASLGLAFDLPLPDVTLKPRYDRETVEHFTRAARICRGDGGGAMRPLHLLVALSDPGLPLFQRMLAALAVDAGGWRRLLAAVEPPGPRTAGATPSGLETPTRTGADLLSPEQAASALGVHIQTLRGYIRRGKLQAFRLAGERVIRIRRDDLLALLDQPVEAGAATPQDA